MVFKKSSPTFSGNTVLGCILVDYFYQYPTFQVFSILQEMLTRLFVLFAIRYAKKGKHVKPTKSKSSCCVPTVTGCVLTEDDKMIFHSLSRDAAMAKTSLLKARKDGGL